jgi:hypothetical protein
LSQVRESIRAGCGRRPSLERKGVHPRAGASSASFESTDLVRTLPWLAMPSVESAEISWRSGKLGYRHHGWRTTHCRAPAPPGPVVRHYMWVATQQHQRPTISTASHEMRSRPSISGQETSSSDRQLFRPLRSGTRIPRLIVSRRHHRWSRATSWTSDAPEPGKRGRPCRFDSIGSTNTRGIQGPRDRRLEPRPVDPTAARIAVPPQRPRSDVFITAEATQRRGLLGSVWIQSE